MAAATVESPVLETPKWLEALENKRKRPHRLAHEIGAGSPCLVCKEKCKGLNLHFWRKLCIECKCRKEDHDVVEEEDYAQFEILFGAKKVKRMTLKFNAQKKTFDWLPPNTSPDLVVDYLNSLPESKLPISNTDGAKYRKQQLEKQLPLHDVDPNACHDLTDKEMKEFEKYLDNLKNNIIGQGKIMKYQTPLYREILVQDGLPSSQLAVNEPSWSLQPNQVGIEGCYKVIHNPEINNAVVQNINASSYPVNGSVKHNSVNQSQVYSENINSQASSAHPLYLIKSSANKQEPLTSQLLGAKKNTLPSNVHLENSTAFSPQKPELSLSGPKPYTSILNQPNEQRVQSADQNFINGGSSFPLKTPSSFIDKKTNGFDSQNNNRNVYQRDDNCNDKLESNDNSQHLTNQNNSFGNNTVPYEPLPYEEHTEQLKNFNGLNVSSDEVPYAPLQESQNIVHKRVPGAEKQDQNGDQLHVAEVQISDEQFESLPIAPQTCRQCSVVLNQEDIVVKTERGGNSELWHARCFICDTCKELLVDLMYFYWKGKVYCGRHYSELMKIPRCFACDELIFVKEYTCAEGEAYHVRHFCCFHCDVPLGGKQYILKDNQPTCLDCYQTKFGKNCHSCLKPIKPNEQRVSWKDLDFHATPDCFRCTKCFKSLLGGKFVIKNNNTFCSKECVQESNQ